jgi:hypothetical protein
MCLKWNLSFEIFFFFFFGGAACSDYSTLPEHMELTKQMDELGLPLSFNTNKEVGLRLLSYGQCLVCAY